MAVIQKNTKTNIVLIGMAGAGKSTVGRELSRLSGLDFVDVDALIEEDQVAPLQNLVNDLGIEGFRALEERVLLTLSYRDHVIATGGSAIYSQAGMEHLSQSGLLVLLDVSLPLLQKRVGDYSTRGLVKTDDMSFEQLFSERMPLYRKYADLTIDCTDRSIVDICQSIMKRSADTFYHF